MNMILHIYMCIYVYVYICIYAYIEVYIWRRFAKIESNINFKSHDINVSQTKLHCLIISRLYLPCEVWHLTQQPLPRPLVKLRRIFCSCCRWCWWRW